jgi:formylglycine-generating enzyme required for sulfatase activity
MAADQGDNVASGYLARLGSVSAPVAESNSPAAPSSNAVAPVPASPPSEKPAASNAGVKPPPPRDSPSNPVDQYKLAERYLHGEGVPSDPVNAAWWYRRAAEQGYADAQRSLGELYETGMGGLPKDYSQARHWYQMAAEQGDNVASGYLARIESVNAPVAETKGSSALSPAATSPAPSAVHLQPITESSPLTEAQERALKPGDSFKECRDCPEMIVVPAGRFMMGSSEGQGNDSERTRHEVTIAKPFAVSKFAVTFDEWDACVGQGDCAKAVGDSGWGRGRRPVINVSWNDAQTYVKWLVKATGKPYRLLSEAEYEYAARAGSMTAYPWGDDIKLDGQAMGNCNGCGSQWDGKETAPVGSFAANRFGLYDMVGNAFEWTEDCKNQSYQGAPADGSPWTSGNCKLRVVRGGSWLDSPAGLRPANRIGDSPGFRVNLVGFRVARTLAP